MIQLRKIRLFAGGAAWAVLCALGLGAPARAQAPAPLPPGPADRALGADGFYLEADSMIRDEEHQTWTARGSIEARYQGKVLRANELVFNEANGVVVARGDVQLLNPDGTSEFAQSMTLDKEFRSGVALAFSTRQQPNVKIAADEAIRLNRDAMALNKAVFTVCDLCAADGGPKTPTWSIQAGQVIQDPKRRIIFYKNVVIRVKGLPVAYTPVFWHTDPSAKRGSGFLAPTVQLDARRGFSYEQPYLIVLSPYSDLVVSPQFNTRVEPLLNAEYRKRFYSGQVDARFGYTYARQFDSHGQPYDDRTSRSYILAGGAFAPTEHWTWGFSAERVTDPLMFQRYTVPNAYDQRGLFSAGDQRLISQLYAVEQSTRSYLSISAMSFQGLRPGDQNGTFPTVAPLIEARYEPDLRILGGRVRLQGGGVLLDRPRAPATDSPPGEDSRRATLGGDWRATYTLYDGIRLSPFLQARGDLYNVSDVAVGDTRAHTTGRALGTAGVDVSWPFFRRNKDLTVILEPMAQLAVSPKAVANPYIPNEDSQVLDFDETNLFEINRSPGFDYYEGGARANVGGRASFRWDGGGQVQLLAGRSLRSEPDPTLPERTSLNRTASDWVVAGTAQPAPGYSAFGRALLNGQTGGVRRLEIGVNGGSARLSGYARYLSDEIGFSSGRVENAQFGGQLLLTKHWGLAGSASWDLASKVAVQQAIGLLYQDECTHWELLYEHNGAYNRALRPSDRIVVRLLLVTLGSTGYQRPDFR